MKLSEFNYFCTSYFQNVFLAYNSFTGSFISLSKPEWDKVSRIVGDFEQGRRPSGRSEKAVKLLQKGGFIVDDSLDERKIVKERYRQKAETKGITVTMAMTTGCNFRCTYCYQNHPNKNISDQDFESLLTFLRSNLRSGEPLSVTWFGGEPLLQYQALLKYSKLLEQFCEQNGSGFHQEIISNGSLLDREKAEALAKLKNLDQVQVTIDGPQQIHDVRRIAIAKRGTYEKILTNLSAACEILNIVIRINVDRTNSSGIPLLIEDLIGRGLKNKVSLYLGQVLPYTDVCSGESNNAFSVEEFSKIEVYFKYLLLMNGFSQPISLPKPRLGSICTADSDNGIVLAPGGLVFRCWNEISMGADKASGNIHSRVNVSAGLGDHELSMLQARNDRKWNSYDPFAHEKCKSCLVQPLCMGGCPWEANKKDPAETGHCRTLKFALGDNLRLHHLQMTILKAFETKNVKPVATISCSA